MCNGSEDSLEECLTMEPGQVSPECTDSNMRAAGVRCYLGWHDIHSTHCTNNVVW